MAAVAGRDATATALRAEIAKLQGKLSERGATPVSGRRGSDSSSSAVAGGSFQTKGEHALAIKAELEASAKELKRVESLERIRQTAVGRKKNTAPNLEAGGREEFEAEINHLRAMLAAAQKQEEHDEEHADAALLPAALASFQLLAATPVVVAAIGDAASAQKLQEAVRLNPADDTAADALRTYATALRAAYGSAITSRVARKGIFRRCFEAINASNTAFKGVCKSNLAFPPSCACISHID